MSPAGDLAVRTSEQFQSLNDFIKIILSDAESFNWPNEIRPGSISRQGEGLIERSTNCRRSPYARLMIHLGII